MPTSKKKKENDETTSKIWVYSGTAVPYTQSFNITDLINITTDKKSGWITQGTLQKPDGTTDRIELITKAAKKHRKGIWVYVGTNIPFTENINLSHLTNTTTDKKSGWITQGTLQTSDGSTHQIEWITKAAQKKRSGIWVYRGTNIPFPENVNLSNLINIITDKKSGWITQGTLQNSDGSSHRIEFITKSAQDLRKGIWVYANTGVPFPENVNLADLTNTTTDKKSGWITQGTLQKSDGTAYQVEFITKNAQKKREGIWVYAGTGIPFPKNVVLAELTNTITDKKSGFITQGTLQISDESTHRIEFITKNAQKRREGIWVYTGTSIPFPENVNLENLTHTTDKKTGFPQGILQTSDGSTHRIEFITKSAQKEREGIWVYANTGIPFPEKVNLTDLTNTTTDKKTGWITQGTLQKSDGSSYQLEFITKAAQKPRERIWVYAGTGSSFPEKVNLENLTHTTTDKKTGWITQGTLQKSDGSIHEIEFITKAVQKQRNKRQLDQASADVSTNTTRTHGLFQSPVTDPSKQLEKNDQNKPHKRVKR